MRILVVDDEQSFAGLLARALKRLGHTPIVATHPQDALRATIDHEIDAVITDIDMPEMSGIDLALALRAEDPTMPIAFCTGSDDPEVLAAAARIGRVLPKVWTVADVRELVKALEIERSFARGSQPDVTEAARRASAATPSPPGSAATAVPAAVAAPEVLDSATDPSARIRLRKIKVTCRTWDQVERLCEQHSAGKNVLTLRGSHRLRANEKLVVALSLPDELVLSIAAEVTSARQDPSDGAVFCITLTGLTPEVAARLRSLILAGQGATGAGTYRIRRATAPPPLRDHLIHEAARLRQAAREAQEPDAPPEDDPGDGANLGNLRLRQQIDRLPLHMRASTEDLTG
jgi:CheY-like chemotaxis protein